MSNEINHRDDITFDECVTDGERKETAIFLTNYLKEKHDGFVLNLNGEWGSGKSFFIKAWKNLIEEEHPTIYIDTWKTDFSNNPLIVILHSLVEKLKEIQKDEIGFDQEVEKRLILNGTKLARTIGNLSAPWLSFFIPNGHKIGEGIAGLSQFIIDQLEKTNRDYESYKNSIVGLDDFKQEISNILTNIEETQKTNQKQLPLFIFIDELDRCRPTYAIEVLETIKHLFNCKKIVFVAATNTDELEKSISNVYGTGFSSQKYLSRFFNRTASLPALSISQYIESRKGIEILKDILPYSNHPSGSGGINLVLISKIFESFKIQIRECDKLLEYIISTYTQITDKRKIDIITITTLVCIKECYPKIYEEINSYQNIISIIDNKIKLFEVKIKLCQSESNIKDIISKIFSKENELEGYYNNKRTYPGISMESEPTHPRDIIGNIFIENKKQLMNQQNTEYLNIKKLKSYINMSSSIT